MPPPMAIAATLTLALALSQVAPEAQPQRSDWDALGVPLLSFNSDVGFGFGAVAGAYFYGGSGTTAPYQHAISAQVFSTTGGERNHFITYDGPGLLGPLRVEAKVEFRRELLEPYYGPGNLSQPPPFYTDKQLEYDRLSPGGFFRFRGQPLGYSEPLQLYAGYAYHYVTVRPYAGSLLEAEQPYGIQGGNDGQVLVGALWDTRDNETDPTTGGLHELDLRIAGPATWNDYSFSGFTLVERRFFRLDGPRLVLAERVMLDALTGAVPFYEWSEFGDITSAFGLGGMYTLRGVPRNRYTGNVKLLSNTELRTKRVSVTILKKRVELGTATFLDLGRVWQPGFPNGRWYNWHAGVGLGLRATHGAAVVRADYAIDVETGRQGVYLTFGHLF